MNTQTLITCSLATKHKMLSYQHIIPIHSALACNDMDVMIKTGGVVHKPLCVLQLQRPTPRFGSFSNCTPRLLTVTCASTTVTTTTTTHVPHPPTLKHKRPQNVEGNFYVNHKCIDCDVCRWMAPETYRRVDGQAAVYKQPDSAEERTAALQALLSCPVGSIRTENPPSDILQVHLTMPLPIDERTLPGVYHCGYHSKKSYGATSYLIKHPKGNILVDSPSFKEKLARQIDDLGGARYMFLSHRDDVADHDKWARRLSCDRILHINEVQSHTADVEMKLEGQGPWSLYPDIDLIFTPGHTEGSVSLFYKPLKALFTGDHLAASHNGELNYFEKYNWYSVEKQLENIRAFLQMDFLWILPGHGRRIKFENIDEKNAAIEKLLSGVGVLQLV